MSKISYEFENPIDIVLSKIAHKIKPTFYSLNFNPNNITTISVIFGVCSIYSLYKDQYVLSAIMLLLSYFFDILDGIYARSYDMVTKFGDYYDHVSDLALYAILIPMIIYKCKNKMKLLPFLIIFFISLYFSMLQLGCQEKIYNTDQSSTLVFLKKLCPNPPEKTIKCSRFLGCGTTILLLMMLIIISCKIN
jgi:phosphatidylglycerophosphate synthase